MWSIIMVDLPGVENFNQGNQEGVNLLNEMVFKFLRNLEPGDLVVLIKDGLSNMANEHLFAKPEFKELNLNSQNSITVVTKVNSVIKPDTYKKKFELEKSFFEELDISFGENTF